MKSRPHPPSLRPGPSLSHGRGKKSPRLINQLAPLADALLQPDEDRFADQEMADVEFGNLRNGGDGNHIVEGQAMPGMRLDAVKCCTGRAIVETI